MYIPVIIKHETMTNFILEKLKRSKNIQNNKIGIKINNRTSPIFFIALVTDSRENNFENIIVKINPTRIQGKVFKPLIYGII